MTDREIEKAYRNMTESEAPDLWTRIEENLSEKICDMGVESMDFCQSSSMGTGIAKKGDDGMKQTFWGRIRQFLFGGSTFRTAVTVCLMCVIVFGAVNATGLGHMGASSASKSADTAAAAGDMNGYTSGGTAEFGAMQYSADQRMEITEEAAPAEAEMDVDAAYGNGDAAVTAETGASSGTNEDEPASDSEQKQSERKLIRNIYLDVETLEFDRLVDELQKQTEKLGGYVESSSVSGNSYYYSSSRYADLTLRIPKAKTDEFLNQIGEMANIVSRSENVEDITLTYVDVESHIKALRTEEEQLLKILEQAETVEDIMTIQSRLSEVRYQLESYTSRLKTYDNQVDYDTITIYVSEVEEVTPTEELTIWQQMQKGFSNSLTAIVEGFRDLCIWTVVHIPYFVILFVVVLIVTAVVKKIRKKKS